VGRWITRGQRPGLWTGSAQPDRARSLAGGARWSGADGGREDANTVKVNINEVEG